MAGGYFEKVKAREEILSIVCKLSNGELTLK